MSGAGRRMRATGYSGALGPAIQVPQVARSSGHVLEIGLNATLEDGLHIDFERVGLKQATTFPGLCAAHDNAVFSPIEKSDIDFNSPEHLFLLAYRASIKELHEQLESASKLQSGYLSRVRRGLDPSDTPSRAGIEAMHRMMTATRLTATRQTLIVRTKTVTSRFSSIES